MAIEKMNREPLLYIQQPDFNKPKIMMQTIYVSPNSKGKSSREAVNEKKVSNHKDVTKYLVNTNDEVVDVILLSENSEVQEGRKEHTSENIQAIIEEYDSKYVYSEQHTSTGYPMNTIKSFKEMDINERISYLRNFPKKLPPVTCLYMTKDQLLRGFLVGKTDEKIEIKQLNQSIITLKIKEIIEIKMLGY